MRGFSICCISVKTSIVFILCSLKIYKEAKHIWPDKGRPDVAHRVSGNKCYRHLIQLKHSGARETDIKALMLILQLIREKLQMVQYQISIQKVQTILAMLCWWPLATELMAIKVNDDTTGTFSNNEAASGEQLSCYFWQSWSMEVRRISIQEHCPLSSSLLSTFAHGSIPLFLHQLLTLSIMHCAIRLSAVWFFIYLPYILHTYIPPYP